MTEHQTTNAKINILYSNIYGDKPPCTVPLFWITFEDATKRDFDSHTTTIETTKSIRDLQSDVSTLFTSQKIITHDIKPMYEVSAQTRESMNLLLINQQQIMAAVKLPTPMLYKHVTSVDAVPPTTSQPIPSLIPAKKPKGESLVSSPSARWNQQVAQHFNTQDQKEKLEYELLKQATLKEF